MHRHETFGSKDYAIFKAAADCPETKSAVEAAKKLLPPDSIHTYFHENGQKLTSVVINKGLQAFAEVEANLSGLPTIRRDMVKGMNMASAIAYALNT